jgi:DNA-binding response OmpR family regulator
LLPSRAPRGLVLVVDDDERFLAIVGETLTDAGWAVRCESDPDVTMAMVDVLDPDVVVVDLVMPGTDGLDVAADIRRRWPDRQIVLFSSLFDRRVADTATGLGFAYLEKADGPEGLLEHLDRAVLHHS